MTNLSEKPAAVKRPKRTAAQQAKLDAMWKGMIGGVKDYVAKYPDMPDDAPLPFPPERQPGDDSTWRFDDPTWRWDAVEEQIRRDGGSINEQRPYFVIWSGVQRRLVTIADLDARFAILETPGSPSVYVSRGDFMPITTDDLMRRLETEIVQTGTDKDGNPIYANASKVWRSYAKRHVYRSVEFTNKHRPGTVYNLYRGLGVTPKPGKCDLILAHVKNMICAGVESDFEAMLNLHAWQIQNIGKPSRIVVVYRNKNQQGGKGVFLEEVVLKIYGPSGFSPTTGEQILGRFNDVIRGRAFIFCDEVFFAGDPKAMAAIKALSTTTSKGIEGKNLPIVQMPVAVNLHLASNEDVPVHLEQGDARHWILNPSEQFIGNHSYFAALMNEIETGGREAFAHLLLNRDVSNFLPQRDVPRDNAERRAMIRKSLNPYDARVWLEECASAEQILGSLKHTAPNSSSPRNIDSKTQFSNGDESPMTIIWEEGLELSVGLLFTAYTTWQATVRTRAAPRPTAVRNFGEVLATAGFEEGQRSKTERRRALPSAKVCLENLANHELWR